MGKEVKGRRRAWYRKTDGLEKLSQWRRREGRPWEAVVVVAVVPVAVKVMTVVAARRRVPWPRAPHVNGAVGNASEQASERGEGGRVGVAVCGQQRQRVGARRECAWAFPAEAPDAAKCRHHMANEKSFALTPKVQQSSIKVNASCRTSTQFRTCAG